MVARFQKRASRFRLVAGIAGHRIVCLARSRFVRRNLLKLLGEALIGLAIAVVAMLAARSRLSKTDQHRTGVLYLGLLLLVIVLIPVSA